MLRIKSIRDTTIITMDNNRRIMRNASIVIQDDRITWLGPENEFPKTYEHATTIDGKGKVVYPGFINIHAHAALSVVRGIGDELGTAPAYTPGVPQGIYLSKDDCYKLALLGALEAVKFGTTCIVDNYVNEDSAAQAFTDLGIRAIVSELVRDVNAENIPHRIYEFDEKRGEKEIEKNLALIQKWHNTNNGRIKCLLGPHTPDGCSRNFLNIIREEAERHNIGMVIHLSQSRAENAEVLRREGMTPTEYLYDIGILGPKLIAGHCIYVNENDINRLAETKTNVAHLSGSNAKGGMMAPVKKIRDQGINVAVGTDNMSYDMIEVMRLALCTARMLDENPDALKAMDVLEMATINGAKAIQMDHEIGSIETNKKADLVLIDYEKPHLVPLIDPIANLVHNGIGSDIITVLIDGDVIVDEESVSTVDESEVMKMAQKSTELLWKKMGNKV